MHIYQTLRKPFDKTMGLETRHEVNPQKHKKTIWQNKRLNSQNRHNPIITHALSYHNSTMFTYIKTYNMRTLAYTGTVVLASREGELAREWSELSVKSCNGSEATAKGSWIYGERREGKGF